MSNSNVPVKRSSQVPQAPAHDSFIDSFFSDPWFPTGWFPSSMVSMMRSLDNSFRMDVEEDDKEYTIKAEMPGVKKKDISLNLTDGLLTISAEGKETLGDGKKKTRKERAYTYMERDIYLPHAADTGADAKLEDGELIITIPKAPESARQSKIEIK